MPCANDAKENVIEVWTLNQLAFTAFENLKKMIKKDVHVKTKKNLYTEVSYG